MPRGPLGAFRTRRCELRALIRVPDFGLSEAECRLQRRQTEAGLHGVGEFPTDHEAAEPIRYGHQVEEAAMHRKVLISVLQTWLGRSMETPRSKYG